MQKTEKMNKTKKNLRKFSNPEKAQKMAYKYLGRTAKIYRIFDPKHNTWVNFGQMGYQDYTKHMDKTRRKNYLNRSKYIRGNWKPNKYSANNLSRKILW